MADVNFYLQTQRFILQTAVTASATSITVQSFKTIAGTTITDSDIGSGVFATIDAGTEREEVVKITAISQNADTTATLTVTRGIGLGPTYSADSSLRQAHSAGSALILSNPAAFYDTFVNKLNDETMTGNLSVNTPTADAHAATKAYVDTVVNGGAVSINRLVVAGNAGETVAAGDLVYFDSVSDNEWKLADADTASTVDNVLLGIAQGAGTDGNAISGGVLLYGLDANQSGLTLGNIMYASDTAGDISSSAGTVEVTVGIAASTTELYFSPRLDQQITEDIQDALVGSSGTPSSSNKYITEDTTYSSTNDQSQTTQDGSVAAGEADTTTSKNKLAQSFVASRTSIRGVSLYRAADTGTFTGTVTVALQADSSGDPSGSNLASVTITNNEYDGFVVGETDFIFSSEYTGMTQGSTYWIVISTSTSDASNHPNFGINSAGGYANGEVKFNNTTDGWVNTGLSGQDLYFKTINGYASSVLRLDSSGNLPAEMQSRITPAYMQDLAIDNLVNASSGVGTIFAVTSSIDGNTMYVFYDESSGTPRIKRFAKDTGTGQFYPTHMVSVGGGIDQASGNGGVVELGDYVYVAGQNIGSGVDVRRFDKADLTNATSMTDSGGSLANNANNAMYTDGTHLYINDATTAFEKFTISGTTITYVEDITSLTTPDGAFYDGKHVYFSTNGADFEKYTIGGASLGTFSVYSDFNPYSSSTNALNDNLVGFVNIDEFRMYLAIAYSIKDDGSDEGVSLRVKLMPISKSNFV